MRLRSGHQKLARTKYEEDDLENSVTGDPVDGIPEANVYADAADFKVTLPESNINSVLKKSVLALKGKNVTSQHIQEEFTNTSTPTVDVPTNSQPSFNFIENTVFVGIFLILVIILLQNPLYSGCNEEYPGSMCSNTLNKLYQEYPQLKTFWENINATHKICSKSDRPGVILVLHNGNGNVANCIVNRTASALSKLLGVNPEGEFFSVDGRTVLNEPERISFLSIALEQRQKFGVVVFTYLEQLDSGLVEKLHFICDKDPNISDKAIIILVLKVETQTFKNKNLEDMAQREIRDLWGNMSDNRLQPIIGRITNLVASIDENDNTKCS